MVLEKALSNLDFFACDKTLLNEEINGISINPDKVEKGNLFISLKKGDEGKKNIVSAQKKGAVVFVSEEDYGACRQVKVKDVRSAYALIAKRLYHNAADELKLVAVTGTNGKTTTTKILSDILRLSGKRVGVIGTLGATVNGKLIDTGFTTPDPEILHKLLYEMKKAGVQYVVMEASAHALALRKLDGLKFETSVFTNLTQDHLDFFENMENYFSAKEKLFSPNFSKIGVLCIKDNYAKRILSRSLIPMLSYGETNADCFAKETSSNAAGTNILCDVLGDEIKIESNFVGDYNIENLLGAMLSARVLGLSNEEIKSAVKQIYPAEGRFNILKCGNRTVIVDFAHTPDGIEKVLKTARQITKNRLLCVFGCGGNRDRAKRPIMGKITEDLCDEVFVTSDNPRFEKPLDIIAEIEEGMKKDNHRIFEKREDAIMKAIMSCKEGDVLVVAGKGGEKYQDIDGVKVPYDDFKVIKESVKKLLNMKKEINHVK